MEWSRLLPDDQWSVYREVLDEADARKIPFALGGAFAVASYTGGWRNTKDLDIYVLPEYRERMIRTLEDLHFADYFETKPYDRWWIHRGVKNDSIVDVIWAMANHRAQIDDLWMSGPYVEIRNRRVKVLPAEAMFWDKLYIMQRDRCDWPDVLNLLHAAGPSMRWDYLLKRIGDDTPLVAGVLSVFRWLAPGRAALLPRWIWEHTGLGSGPHAMPGEIDNRRVALLDSRPWFGPDREQQAA